MAARAAIPLLLVLLPVINCQVLQYNDPISLVTAQDCNQAGTTHTFFDVSKLACILCSQNKTYQVPSVDLLSCECRPGYRYLTNHGGTAVQCEACGAGQVKSSTGYNCITCPTGTTADTETDTCTPCNNGDPLSISPERTLTGAFYQNGGTNTIQCQTCVTGSQPSADNTRCEKCVNSLPVTENNSCSCLQADNKEKAGGFCFPSSDFTALLQATSQQLYTIPLTTQDTSAYFQYNLKAAFALCRSYQNITACQVLANLCVLTLYEYSVQQSTATNACEMYRLLLGQSFWPANVPWLYYVSLAGEPINGDDVLLEDYLQTQYTFTPPSMLEYRVAQYTLDGTYEGLHNVLNGRLQLCADTSNKLNAAYVFGTTYAQSCKISAIDLWDQTKYPMRFFDPYLEINQNGEPELYAVPVLILNYRDVGSRYEEINRGELKDMVLFRRFFLVDNIGTIPTNGEEATVVRYASSITIDVELQEDTTQGVIYPPTIKIEYGYVTLEDAKAGAAVEVSFNVDYSYTNTNYKQDFRIAVGTLSTLGVIYAGYKAWVWSKRAGRPNLDFQTIANFFFFCAGSLANVFFMITFGMAFYWLIFFKRQSVVYLVHPTESMLKDWTGLFGSAFALKFLEVAHMTFMQVMTDVFFIDWERSRGLVGSADASKSKENPVSIWRTYFVANEWNELQAVRKTNTTFQVWGVVFFLVVVGFENAATRDPDGSVSKDSADYKAEYSSVYRYAVAVLVYMVLGIVQWIFFTFIFERFFEDKVRQYVDLCSMSNISVFVMAHAQFGHYIHGRSVHGKADTNMRDMFEMLKKEEEDMCGKRGLLAGTEQQTFIMSLPKKLRLKYDTVLMAGQLESAAAAADRGRGGRLAGTAMEKQVEAYSTVNKFLSAFIDHSLRDVDYYIKDKTFLENIMDTEFYDASETGIFYNDDGHSFDRVLFYGNEMTLLLFDILTFCVVDLIFTNYVVAGVVTYLLSEGLCYVRHAGGERNLAKKTLVDERFLI